MNHGDKQENVKGQGHLRLKLTVTYSQGVAGRDTWSLTVLLIATHNFITVLH